MRMWAGAGSGCSMTSTVDVSSLPNPLQSKLNLSGGCRSTGNCSCRSRGLCASSWGREGNQTWSIKVRAVQQVENLSAKLKRKPFTQRCSLEDREVPCRQTWTDQRVSTQIAIEATRCWRSKKGVRIKPVRRFPNNDRAGKVGIDEGPDWISSVAVVRGVIAKLWRKGEPRLDRHNAVD